MREILTIQMGPFANHIGSHWWNMQEATFVFDATEAAADETRVNHSLQWRAGKNQRGQDTLTPRLIAIDHKSMIGGADLSSAVYGESGKDVAAAAADSSLPTETLHRPTTSNPFLDDLRREQRAGNLHSSTQTSIEGRRYHLDDLVKSWSQFLRVPLHPRSIIPIADNDACRKWSEGEEALAATLEEIEEGIRRYAEEADEGMDFQLLFDAHDGFGAFGVGAVEQIRTEFPRSALLSFPAYPHLAFAYADERSQVAWNTTRWLMPLLESTLISPLSVQTQPWAWPHSNGAPQLGCLKSSAQIPFHASAILAAALETGTGTWRTRLNPPTLSEALAQLASKGQRIASLRAHFLHSPPLSELNPPTLSPYAKEGKDEGSIWLWTTRGNAVSEKAAAELESGGGGRGGGSMRALKAPLKAAPPFPQSLLCEEGIVKDFNCAAVFRTSEDCAGLLGEAWRSLDGRRVCGKDLAELGTDQVQALATQLHQHLAQHYPSTLP